MKLQINNPCHESWEGMSPNNEGRLCAACEKVVVDFTNMKDEEIIQFFHRPKEEKICGRFNSSQVGRKLLTEAGPWDDHVINTKHELSNGMRYNYFALVLLFAVASSMASCESKTTGEVNVTGQEQPVLREESLSSPRDTSIDKKGMKSNKLPGTVESTDEINNCVIPDEGEYSLKGEVVRLMGDTVIVE